MNYLEKIIKLYGINETKQNGFSEVELLELENRESLKIPPILREFYLKLGKNKAINYSFNCLLKPKDQAGFSKDRYFVFYEENQSTIFWGIKETDLKFDNPHVYGNYDAINLTEYWFLSSETTEEFLLSMAFWNGVMGGLKYNANTELQNDLIEKTVQKIETNWIEVKSISVHNLRFFTKDFLEIIILTRDLNLKVNGLYIGSNNKRIYMSIIDELKVEWDYRADLDE